MNPAAAPLAAQLRVVEGGPPAVPAVQLATPCITLELFARLQDGTVSLRTLEQQAAAGKLAGAYRPEGSRIWWINLLVQAAQGLQSIREDDEKEAAEAPPAREWRGGAQGRPERDMDVPRQKAPQGPPPSPRYRPH